MIVSFLKNTIMKYYFLKSILKRVAHQKKKKKIEVNCTPTNCNLKVLEPHTPYENMYSIYRMIKIIFFLYKIYH